jgi:hypothetical protein
LIARFGHHLALNWNLGEENGEWIKNHPTPPQETEQRLSMINYFEKNDPYNHHLVIHNGIYFDDLLGKNALTGPSIQTHHADFRFVHTEVLKWLEQGHSRMTNLVGFIVVSVSIPKSLIIGSLNSDCCSSFIVTP